MKGAHPRFRGSAGIYDALYAAKDYALEVERLRDVIARLEVRRSRTLLDVACGTGRHLEHLARHYDVEGLDIDEGLLAVARERLPNVALHRADMTAFDLGRRFDVVSCLFSAIGYARTVGGLYRALGEMARHVAPGGLLVLEPWLMPDAYEPGTLHATFVDEPDRKIARMAVSEREGDLSVIVMHYLIGTRAGIETVQERHELGLFDDADYRGAMAAFRLRPEWDPEGLTGRGLYVGARTGEATLP